MKAQLPVKRTRSGNECGKGKLHVLAIASMAYAWGACRVMGLDPII